MAGFEPPFKFPFAKASPVKVLFTGKTQAGAWQIRGLQMAACRTNWHAANKISSANIETFDLICVVKRPVRAVVEQIAASDRPVVYDIVDSWAQPDDNVRYTDPASAKAHFARKWEGLPFNSFIFPNHTMQRHLSSLTPHSTFIYHHYRPGILENPIRPEVKIIAYEGNEAYLGQWRGYMESYCEKRGMSFVLNPENWANVDIGFAARGGIHDCFLANQYKSNVKLANFYGSGTPCVVSAREMSCQETDSGAVLFFETPEQLELQLDKLTDYNFRRKIHECMMLDREAFRIETIADVYDFYFQEVLRLHKAGALRPKVLL